MTDPARNIATYTLRDFQHDAAMLDIRPQELAEALGLGDNGARYYLNCANRNIKVNPNQLRDLAFAVIEIKAERLKRIRRLRATRRYRNLQ